MDSLWRRQLGRGYAAGTTIEITMYRAPSVCLTEE
jgi:hypothetical protein